MFELLLYLFVFASTTHVCSSKPRRTDVIFRMKNYRHGKEQKVQSFVYLFVNFTSRVLVTKSKTL